MADDEHYWDEESLDGLDESEGADDQPDAAPVASTWRRTTVSGAVVTAVVRGFAEVFEPRRDEVAIVAAIPGAPPGPPGPLTVELDEDDPAASSVVVRPWLLDQGEGEPTGR